jgi:hypothetical protein
MEKPTLYLTVDFLGIAQKMNFGRDWEILSLFFISVGLGIPGGIFITSVKSKR